MTKILNRETESEKRQSFKKDSTEAENILWANIRNKKFKGHKFKRYYSIDSYIVDFYCPKAKLAIEINGYLHYTEEENEYDRGKEKFLKSVGIRTLHFTNDDVYLNLDNILDAILKALN